MSPFIKQEQRKLLEKKPWAAITPGDKCYVFYKEMVDKWKKNPRWTTAHEIFRDVLLINEHQPHLENDDSVANHLAWQVFFQLHVIPYELQKMEENGDI
jgi:hypothetical protein